MNPTLQNVSSASCVANAVANASGNEERLSDLSIGALLVTCAIICPILVSVGFVGNAVCIYVFRKVHLGIGQSALVYYTAIAISEIWMLLHLQFINFFLGIGLKYFGLQALTVWHANIVACKLHRFCYWFGGHVVTWLYVALAADRAIAIFTPLESRYRLTRCRTLFSISTIVIVGLAMHGPICLGAAEINPNAGNWCDPGSCDIPLLRTFITFYVVEGYLLPTAVATVLNLLLLFKTVSLNRNRLKLSASSDVTRAVLRRREVARNVTVLAICSVHIIFYWPFPILYLLYLYHESNLNATTEYRITLYSSSMMAHILTGVCYCINFFIFIARLPGFRRAVFCRVKGVRKSLSFASTAAA